MKNCKYCKKEMIKREGEPESAYKSRRYCNSLCRRTYSRIRSLDKYQCYIEAGFIEDFKVMTLKHIAEKHNIPMTKADYIAKLFGLKRMDFKIGYNKKRNEDIRNKFIAGCGIYSLAREYNVCDRTIKDILGKLLKRKEFEFGDTNRGEPGIFVGYIEPEITARTKRMRYNSYTTNEMWSY